MLKKLAVWYLRKSNCSVLIGFEIKSGYVRSIKNNTFIYDNELCDVEYRTSDDERLFLPKGKFSIQQRR
ncbi:hypothetical protein SAMN05421839_10629 [Halolactibacillus halophilus]|uniref:Uncharacterized protein n=1 Tax=Halolactibacillus halophilus TaxID=306540 RepID=A0A1I5MN87_9BACI|nr:hypothetical protein HHA03_20530 [Halolactibacillus halophilus]SFP11062.1 hypothetical protein SAMN05421839_10629 [Halolactibacillus halophilus]